MTTTADEIMALAERWKDQVSEYMDSGGYSGDPKASRDALRTAVERLVAERDQARAALSAPAGWQPIETAPKDGSVILIWPYLGRVDTDYWNERTDGGWLLGVTHWMPLPNPPAAPSPQEQTNG